MSRLISCCRCGRIHREGECTVKPTDSSGKVKTKKYRSCTRWNKVRKIALERDYYMCKMCLAENVITRDKLEVHHIIPIAVDSNKAYDVDNLITLCVNHHKMVEGDKRYNELLHELQTFNLRYLQSPRRGV